MDNPVLWVVVGVVGVLLLLFLFRAAGGRRGSRAVEGFAGGGASAVRSADPASGFSTASRSDGIGAVVSPTAR
jgi:hypothetical protein